MNKSFHAIIFYLFLVHGLSAQGIHEFGALLGISQYQGDLALRHFEWRETRSGGGFFYRSPINGSWQWRAQLSAGEISGDDRHAPARAFRQLRFRRAWLESALKLEWQWRPCASWYYVGLFRPHWTPYFFAGIGAARFRGRTEYYGPGLAERLGPMDGEPGQEWFFTLPYGVGVRWDFAPGWRLGWEAGQRPVFSDHLDGVSQRGNPKRRDWYLASGFTLSYLIGQRKYREINDR